LAVATNIISLLILSNYSTPNRFRIFTNKLTLNNGSGLNILKPKKYCMYGFSCIVLIVSLSDNPILCLMIKLPITILALTLGVSLNNSIFF